MDGLKLDISNVYPFASEESILGFQEQALTQLTSLNKKTGAGNDFLGWLELPSNIPEEEINKLEEVAAFLREKAEIIVVVGIGGSYLGAKSIISAMSHNFDKYKAGKKGADVIFAGQNIGEDYLSELIEVLDTRSYAIIVISKSGTTTEPAIAFRILKEHLEEKVGPEEANQRIIAITDKSKGALRELADQVGYRSFIIPDDVGGRYSV